MNAKELILVKLNATSEFADLYSAALSTGMSFEDISNIMTSKIFNIVAKYSRKNIFDINTNKNTLKNAINFVLNKEDLNVIRKGFLKAVLTQNKFLEKLRDIFFGNNNQVNELNKLKDIKAIKDLRNNVGSYFNKDNEFNKNSYKDPIYNSILQCLEEKDSHKILKDIILNHVIEYYKMEYAKSFSNNYNNDDVENDWEEAMSQDYEDMFNDDQYDFDYNQLSKNDEIDFSKVSWKNYKDLYIYLKHYLFPKNEEIIELYNDLSSKNDNNKMRLAEVVRLIDIADEIKMNGKICGINQGVKNNNLDESNWVNDIDSFINRKYYEYTGTVPKEGFIPFDLITFISDEEYRKKQIAQYDLVRSSINILKTITDVKHFSKMLSFVEINRKAVENAFIIKLSKKLYKELLEKTSKKESRNGIEYNKIIKLGKKSISKIREFSRDVLIMNWLNSIKDNNDYKFLISYIEGKSMSIYRKNSSYALKIGQKTETSLNNMQSYGTIKHLIDWYIIPELQKLYPNNEFLKRIMIDGYWDKEFKNIYTYSRISAKITNFENSVRDTAIYDSILNGLKDIAYLRLSDLKLQNKDLANISNIRIGDLFFLYNILENKDGFGKNSFTRLFEDLVAGETNRLTLVNSYYKFLYDLDSNQSNNDINLKYYINDLRWLVAKSNPSDAWKLNAKVDDSGKVTFDGNNTEQTVVFLPIEYPIKYPSQYSEENNDFEISSGNKNNIISREDSEKYPDTNIEIMKAIANSIKEKGLNMYGNEVDIEFYDGSDIDFLESRGINSVEYSDAKGFIKDGVIYINLNRSNNTGEITGALIHELSHLIAGIFKIKNRDVWYSLIENLKSQYYTNDKIKRIVDSIKENYYTDKTFQKINSDIFEEALMHIIEENFVNKNSKTLNNLGINQNDMQNNITNIISEIFQINNNDIKNLNLDDLSQCDIASFIKYFKSSIMDYNELNYKDWSIGIVSSSWLLTVKKLIFEQATSIENC